jgi:glycosyltransferase involved in cell wall biosynthesis
MLDLAREFTRLGHVVELVLMEAKGEFLPEAVREFSVIDLATRRTRVVSFPLAKYLRRRKPACLIANMWPLTSAAVLGRLLSFQRCRLLLVEHNTLTQQYSSWGKLHYGVLVASMFASYRFADVVAAVSEGSALDTAMLAGMDPNQVKVLHNPIPLRSRSIPPLSSLADTLWDCPPGQRILTVGSLKDQKNHQLLLRAFARLQHPDARLMLLGQGENLAALRVLVEHLGISDRVIFAGFHADPAPFYSTADLFALSSNYEGLPTVLIEALGFGLPIVATDCPSGPAEILGNGRYGALVPVGDAEALAAAIEEALDAPVDRTALMRRAADFAPETAAIKYLDILGLK